MLAGRERQTATAPPGDPPTVKRQNVKADDRVKLCCGHRVDRKVAKVQDGDTGWCPTCKRHLFTGWFEHMERNVATAERLKERLSTYLDDCVERGKAPTLVKLVAIIEPVMSAVDFGRGHDAGSAIDAD